MLALAGEPDANEPALLAAIAGTQPGGSGTAKDPYRITGAAELIWLRDAVNRLFAAIDEYRATD